MTKEIGSAKARIKAVDGDGVAGCHARCQLSHDPDGQKLGDVVAVLVHGPFPLGSPEAVEYLWLLSLCKLGLLKSAPGYLMIFEIAGKERERDSQICARPRTLSPA